MSKLVSPYPPRDYDPDFLPGAHWWRLRLQETNPEGFIYAVKLLPQCKHSEHHEGSICPKTTVLEWEWFDGYDTILDAGLDIPNVAAMTTTYIAPNVEYMDILTDHQPTPCDQWVRITKIGERDHPGYGPFADVGDPDGPDSMIEDAGAACEILGRMNFGNPLREIGRWP